MASWGERLFQRVLTRVQINVMSCILYISAHLDFDADQ